MKTREVIYLRSNDALRRETKYVYAQQVTVVTVGHKRTPNPRFLRTRHYLMKVSKVRCQNHYITITLIFAPSIFALPIFGGPNVRKN